MRFDVPCIGAKTIETCAAAKISVLALEAGKTLVLEQETVEAMARRADVARVFANPTVHVEEPVETITNTPDSPGALELNISNVNAPQVLAAGLTGPGAAISRRRMSTIGAKASLVGKMADRYQPARGTCLTDTSTSTPSGLPTTAEPS